MDVDLICIINVRHLVRKHLHAADSPKDVQFAMLVHTAAARGAHVAYDVQSSTGSARSAPQSPLLPMLGSPLQKPVAQV